MRILALLVAIAAMIAACAECESIKWSPDHKQYAETQAGQRVGMGEERKRLVVRSATGRELAVAHVWLVEPNGMDRVGIRGCENWGWVDNRRLFCEGTINPSTGIYLVFDAGTGRELGEYLGSVFTWSPDRSMLANFGSVPHFSDWENKSDSLEIGGKPVYPNDGELHLFKSQPTWSPDSRRVAVVDHHRRKADELYLVVAGVDGSKSELRLGWQIAPEDYGFDHDFRVQWNGEQVTVTHGGTSETVTVRASAGRQP